MYFPISSPTLSRDSNCGSAATFSNFITVLRRNWTSFSKTKTYLDFEEISIVLRYSCNTLITHVP
jgi:hypothetical protein